MSGFAVTGLRSAELSMFRSKGRNQMEFKRSIISAAVLGATVFSGNALAGSTSVNFGVMSDYLFRGLPQSGGTSAFGGIDTSYDSGLYVGTWVAQTNFAGGSGGADTEVDLYAGFAGEAGSIAYDIGAILYLYTEENEVKPGPQPASNNTFEIYGSASAGLFSLGFYYAIGDYFGAFNVDNPSEAADGAYGISLGFSAPISEMMTFDASIATNGGEGNEFYTQTFGLGSTDDSYIDYSIGVNAEAESGMFMGLSLVGTDIEGPVGSDKPKVIVSGGFAFDI